LNVSFVLKVSKNTSTFHPRPLKPRPADPLTQLVELTLFDRKVIIQNVNKLREGVMNCVAETFTKMIESLPEHLQKKLLDEITPIISAALDEAKWEEQFQRGSSKLVELAEAVKDQLSKGGIEPMDFSKL